jgi:hypothetical protein
MSVRKELITKTKETLAGLTLNDKKVFKLIDLQKGQFDNPEKAYGTIYTAALIEIDDIRWEAMTNRVKEGQATIRVYLYTKEGFADQFYTTPDPKGGLHEITIQDIVVEGLDTLKGECFKPMYLSNEGALPAPHFGIMAYKLEFTTWVYQQLKSKYVSK